MTNKTPLINILTSCSPCSRMRHLSRSRQECLLEEGEAATVLLQKCGQVTGNRPVRLQHK